MVAATDNRAGEQMTPSGGCSFPASYAANPLSGCTSPDKIISPIHESLPVPPAAQQVLVDMNEMLNKAAERLEAQLSMKLTKIHRFPHHLRGIGGPEGRYVVPSVVAIGPYHHGLPHLQEMEEVKQAAAHRFCRDSGRSVDEVYAKILSVAGDARRCYAAAADMSLVARLSDAEFAAMMFLDGCFLLQLIAKYYEPPIAGRILSSSHSIYKDVFMLENQIPWLVLESLMEFMPTGNKEVRRFIRFQTASCFTDMKEKKTDTIDSRIKNADLKPPHLLGLFRSILTHDITSLRRHPTPRPPEVHPASGTSPRHHGLLRFISKACGVASERREDKFARHRQRRLSSSAVYLAQMGIKLTPSTTGKFANMRFQKKLVSGELFLYPLYLKDVSACYLVNFVALEAAEATNASNMESDGCVVTSYLSVLAMLVDREEDVQQLRGKGMLSSHFSNAETLAFFKGLRRNLRAGYNYQAIVRDISNYMRKRPVRIVVHRFIYNNYKLIVAVLSIASVLVGIFKALYSLKKP
ncbi:hypothetical protein ACP4OV_006092 [Aristida adscensionis]